MSPDGTLELNIGTRAAERLAVNTEDGDEVFSVAHLSGDPGAADGEKVAVTAFGITLQYDGVKRIRGIAGDGNDSVTIGADVLAPVELWGDHLDLMAGRRATIRCWSLAVAKRCSTAVSVTTRCVAVAPMMN